MKNGKLKLYEILVLIAVVILAAVVYFVPYRTATTKNQANILTFAPKPVSVKEIYPMFLCPCCGQPLNPENICCPMAKERIDYIDSLAAKNISEKEIILSYVQKYGLNSFVDEKKKEEFKKELIKTAPEIRPQIIVTPDTLDLGDVSQKKGIVSVLFGLKNEGRKDLVINKMDTSCGCTSASIVYKGEEGPRFAMAGHGIESPAEWQIIIFPGEEAKLKVYYDPDVHKDFRGPAIREIYIYSNDPIDFEKKVSIELNQVD